MLRERVEEAYPLDRSTHLRQTQSPPEGVLWSLLRDRRLEGLKFRRQHAIRVYVADFYCAEANLVVELDGGMHAERVEQDRWRDEFMRGQGLQVYRVTVSRFMRESETVLREIAELAKKRIQQRKETKSEKVKKK